MSTTNSVSNGSTFVSRVSPVTGQQEWVLEADDYDFHQEVARAAYADMLHDTERNRKYDVALRSAIELMHSRGQEAHVLDIGTGTGLLSMMAVRSGADTVTACEAFAPMADCAKQVMKDNGFSDKIRLIPKRSTDIIVGPDGDMPRRANILVTEVFDTELIGEGAIPTFSHAHQDLLEEDCIVVPTEATVYAQVVHSTVARNWSKFQPIPLPDGQQIHPPDDISNCSGSPSVHDLQMDQIQSVWFTPVSDPVKVFSFPYDGKSPIEPSGHSVNEVKALAAGKCDAVFMWWDLKMDTKGDVMLSCAPGWAQPSLKQPQWRDHWMQAVYYPSTSLEVSEGETFVLHSCHDEYSLWFDVNKMTNSKNTIPPEPSVCRCGAHMICSWSRIGMMNDSMRNSRYLQVLEKIISSDSVCLSVSDGSLLPLVAAKLGAKRIYTLEMHPMSRNFTERYVKANGLADKVVVFKKHPEELTLSDVSNEKVNVLISEPFFHTSVLPWHNLLFWYSRTEVQDLLDSGVRTMPWVAQIKAVAVNFDDLWKIRAPVVDCEGFRMEHFDKIIDSASSLADAYLEPQPLWEYPGVPLSNQFDILSIDFSKPLSSIKTIERDGFIELWGSGDCNGVAVWMDYYLDSTDVQNVITTGLLVPPVEGERLQWDIHTRQAVHLFPKPTFVPNGQCHKWKLKHKVIFKPKSGDLSFKFEVVAK